MKLRQFGRLRVVFADSAYGRNGLPAWVKEAFGWILQTVLRPVAAKGFIVLPKRWIVERTFAWISRCRRHSKDGSPDQIEFEDTLLLQSWPKKPRAGEQVYVLRPPYRAQGPYLGMFLALVTEGSGLSQEKCFEIHSALEAGNGASCYDLSQAY